MMLLVMLTNETLPNDEYFNLIVTNLNSKSPLQLFIEHEQLKYLEISIMHLLMLIFLTQLLQSPDIYYCVIPNSAYDNNLRIIDIAGCN
jgi:hypothetical protein